MFVGTDSEAFSKTEISKIMEKADLPKGHGIWKKNSGEDEIWLLMYFLPVFGRKQKIEEVKSLLNDAIDTQPAL